MYENLKKYVQDNLFRMQREPEGILKYPYIVPGSRQYAVTLWDWDSWWTSVAMGQAELDAGEKGRYLAYEEGCVLNFLDHMSPDGKIPITLSNRPFGNPEEAAYYAGNNHKPVLAQMAAYLVRCSGEDAWILPHLAELDTFVSWFVKCSTHEETGLAYWVNDYAVGVDNEPVVFFRPEKSCGSLYLNSLLYREELAMSYLCGRAGDAERAAYWKETAERLTANVRNWCWDDRDESFYSVDLNLMPVDKTGTRYLHKNAPRSWPCLLMRYDTWTDFLPMWAGIATSEQARKMLKKLFNPGSFLGNYGIRTLSAKERMYNMAVTNNPSNWLGPVWGVSNYMVFSGLVRYGFDKEARDIAERSVKLFAADVENTGTLHEYYNPDTGEGIRTPDFQNWNCLVLNMLAFLEGRERVEEF